MALVIMLSLKAQNASLPYQNPQLKAEQRADDLLSRLTLEEKVQLMMDTSPAIEHLQIPQFQWWNEALHGVGRNGYATVFPITMAMAASWDEAYKKKLRPYVVKFNDYIKSFDKENPYGVPIGLGNWAGVNAVLSFGITVNYANIYYPDIVSKDEVYRVANWLYGCHPYHNYSFVAVVGATRPKQVFYGNNRADFSFIPGNVAPGLLFRKPDHFENFDDWPFLWGQNEGTIAGNTQYIIFGSSLKGIMNVK